VHTIHSAIASPLSAAGGTVVLKKVYFTPSTAGVGILNPLNYETVYSTPELSKTGQITP
jgi:hypothetical protein